MLLIESVKVVEIKGDNTRVITCRPEIQAFDPDAIMEESIETELVIGHRFRHADGREVCIGMPKKVEEVLGLPFEIYGDLTHNIESLQRELAFSRNVNFRLRYRLETIKGMSFWERLSRVFVGFYTLSIK